MSKQSEQLDCICATLTDLKHQVDVLNSVVLEIIAACDMEDGDCDEDCDEDMGDTCVMPSCSQTAPRIDTLMDVT